MPILRITALIFTLLLAATPAAGQLYGVITGTVIDGRSNMPVGGAAIRLLSLRDTTIYTATSEASGAFRIHGVNELGRYLLSVERAGYAGYLKVIETRSRVEELGRMVLIDSFRTLSEAVVTGRRKAFTVKGDTVEYDAAYYKTAPDMDAVYLINKMPGIDLRGGTANGDSIKRYSINGLAVFNQDALRMLSQIPAGYVEKVQVTDNPDDSLANGARRLMPGKALNVQTKAGYLLTPKGKVYGGYGIDNYYLAGGNLMQQKGARQLSLDGSVNRGDVPYGSYYDPVRPYESQGISVVRSLSASYGNALSKKDQLNVRYGLYQYGTEVRQQERYEYNLGAGRSYTETGNSARRGQRSHDVQLTWTRQLSERRKLRLFGQGSVTNGYEQDSLRVASLLEGRSILNVSGNRRETASQSASGGLSLTAKASRRYSSTLRLSAGYAADNRQGWVDAAVSSPDTAYRNRSRNSLLQTSCDGHAGYSATFIADSLHTVVAEFSTDYRDNRSEQSRYGLDAASGAYTIPDLQFAAGQHYTTLLSELELKDIARTARSGLELEYGLSVQRLGLGQVAGLGERSYYGFNPFVELRKKFTATKTVSVYLRKGTEMPSYTDLNPLINATSSSFYTTGNPGLRPAQRLDAGWTFRSPFLLKESFFNAGTRIIYIRDNITQSVILPVSEPVVFRNTEIPVGVALQYADNVDDHRNAYGWIGLDAPLPVLKMAVKLKGSGGYGNSASRQNGELVRNLSRSWSGSLTLTSVLSEKLDYTLYGSYTYDHSGQEGAGSIARRLHQWRGSALVQVQTFRHQSLRIESSINYVSGLSSPDKTRFYLVDVFYKLKFLKNEKLTCTLLIHDLFDSYRYFSYSYDYFKTSFTQNAIYSASANSIRRYGLVMLSYDF